MFPAKENRTQKIPEGGAQSHGELLSSPDTFQAISNIFRHGFQKFYGPVIDLSLPFPHFEQSVVIILHLNHLRMLGEQVTHVFS